MNEQIRFWRKVWGASLLMILVVLLLFLWLPFDGSAGDAASWQNGQSFQIKWLLQSQESSLQAGDVILLMDGQQPAERLKSSFFSSLPEDGMASYRILRDNSKIDVQVPLAALDPGAVFSVRYVSIALGLFFLLLSAAFLWKPSRADIDHFVAFFFLAAAFLTWLDVFDIQSALLYQGWFFWLVFACRLVAGSILAGTIVNMAILFPEPLNLAVRYPRQIALGVYAFLPVAVLTALLLSPSIDAGFFNASQVLLGVELAELLLAALLLVYHRIRCIRARQVLNNLRLYWLGWGMLLSLLVFALLSNLHFELGAHALYPDVVLRDVLFFLPFLLAALLQDRRLLYIDEMFDITIVYGFLMVVAGGAYILILRFFEWVFQNNADYANLFHLSAAVLTVLLSFWLRPQIQFTTDRLFFRSKLSMRRVLPWIEGQMAHIIDMNSLSSWLIKELPYHLQINHVALLVLNEDELVYTSVDGDTYLDLAVGHSLPNKLKNSAEKLVRIIDEKQLDAEARVYLQKNQVELSLPLMGGEKLIGLLNLGYKNNGSPYTHREIELLTGFSRHAADAVRNARVYNEANTYNQTLEKQVRQRTTELAHAIHESEEERTAAERASRAKSIFLGSVSHQIRTPMSAVLGMVDLLFNTPLHEDQIDYLHTIQDNSETLLKMIDDILDYSLIEGGKLELEKGPFEIAALIEEALDLVSKDAVEKNLDLSYMLEAHTPLKVVGDSGRLKQILLNVLERGIRYTDEGEIVIYVTSKSMDDPHQQQLHFAVKDTGSIIPPDILETFFQPFQTNDTVPIAFGGTGLGLTISKLLSEAMDGKMWVETSGLEGKGSTVHFTLVVEAEETTYPAYLGVDQPLLEGKCMLLVNPDVQQCKVLTLQLQSWGMHIEQISTAEEALECLRPDLESSGSPFLPEHEDALPVIRNESYDILLISSRLKGMDGMTLSREIRRFYNQKDLPILLSGQGAAPAGREAELVQYIEEPVEAEKLYNMLIEVFIDEGYHVSAETKKSGFDEHMAEYHPLDILVVEDNPVNKKLVMLFLEGLGYRPHTADLGYEALEMVQKKAYDVVLMDVKMPGMDGMDTTRHIHKVLPEGKQPRIIAMTAEAMQGDRQKCLDAGMDDYLSKPIRIWELIAALNKCQKVGGPLRESKEGKSGVPFELSNQQLTVPLSQMARGAEDDLLDAQVMRQLRQGFGDRADTIIPKLVRDFSVDAAELAANMSAALEKSDSAELARAAHILKSNSAAIGAVHLAELAGRLAETAIDGDLLNATERLEAVKKEIEDVLNAFRRNGMLNSSGQ